MSSGLVYKRDASRWQVSLLFFFFLSFLDLNGNVLPRLPDNYTVESSIKASFKIKKKKNSIQNCYEISSSSVKTVKSHRGDLERKSSHFLWRGSTFLFFSLSLFFPSSFFCVAFTHHDFSEWVAAGQVFTSHVFESSTKRLRPAVDNSP